MRTREWRRYTQSTKVKKRLKLKSQNIHWRYYHPNGCVIQQPHWTDFIQTSHHHQFKSKILAYSRYSSGVKYSSNRGRSYYRFMKKDLDSLGTRESDKKQFLKILKDNGLK